MATDTKTDILQIDERATELYWQKRKIDWNEAYFTPYHFHRKQIVDVLKGCEFKSLLEIGCGAGANLYRIKQDFPETMIAGVDINSEAVEAAKRHLPGSRFKQGVAEKIPYSGKFDVVLTDACLMYVPLEKIEQAKSELLRLARKYLILCEWNGNDIFDGHWCHNYKKLFNEYRVGFTKVVNWAGGWHDYGYIALVEVESKR